MLSCTRWLKVGYFLALTTALVLLLSKPAPIQAQRSLAYAFLPGAGATAAAMSSLLTTAATPMVSYNRANQMLMLAGVPAGMSVGGGQGIGGGMGGGVGGGMGGGGMLGGGGMGMSGGMGMGGGGGMMGMGGMNMGGGGGGMMGMGGGGMGGFAGKGMGGFNGKKPL